MSATWAILRHRAEQTDADLIVLVRPSSCRPADAATWEQFRDLAFETGTPVLVLRSPIHLPILTAVLPLDGDAAASGELSAACYLLDCLQAARPLSHVRPLTSPEIHLLHATRDTPDYFGWLRRVERLIHTVEFHSPLPPRTRLREQLVWDVQVEDEIVRRMRERRAQLLMISGRWKPGRAACGSAQDLTFLRHVPGPVMFLPWDNCVAMRGEEAGAERHVLQPD